jgi:hypothetical protein
MRIATPARADGHLLRYGDVVMVGRGVRNVAGAFLRTQQPVVAAAHLMVLGLGGNAELAEFLGWFLNLPETQARLRSFHSGSSVPFVPVGAVESLEVPVPSRALQRKIVKLQVLRAVDQKLVRDIQRRRRVPKTTRYAATTTGCCVRRNAPATLRTPRPTITTSP